MAKIKMIHALTGTVMFVPEERLPEYLSAGHKAAERPEPEAKAPAPKRRAAKPKTRGGECL